MSKAHTGLSAIKGLQIEIRKIKAFLWKDQTLPHKIEQCVSLFANQKNTLIKYIFCVNMFTKIVRNKTKIKSIDQNEYILNVYIIDVHVQVLQRRTSVFMLVNIKN